MEALLDLQMKTDGDISQSKDDVSLMGPMVNVIQVNTLLFNNNELTR